MLIATSEPSSTLNAGLIRVEGGAEDTMQPPHVTFETVQRLVTRMNKHYEVNNNRFDLFNCFAHCMSLIKLFQNQIKNYLVLMYQEKYRRG